MNASRTGDPMLGPTGHLTPREAEVLRLLARGDTNQEIAHELVIATRTTHAHVGAILRKLNVRNRGRAAAWFLTHLPDSTSSTRPEDSNQSTR
jgi:DNA-binding NarL/FixJ family response regulator